MGSTPRKRKAAVAAPNLSGLHLYYPVLVSCELDRATVDVEAKSGDKEPERFYDCRVQPTSGEGAVTLAVCEFAAGKKLKDDKLVEVKATYYVGFSAENKMTIEQEDAFLSELSRASAWPMFRDLFIHIGSQTGDELPLLPNIPHVIIVERNKIEST